MNAETMIRHLDRLSSSGKYDTVAIDCGYDGDGYTIFSFQQDRLKLLQSRINEETLPIAFIAITKRQPIEAWKNADTTLTVKDL